MWFTEVGEDSTWDTNWLDQKFYEYVSASEDGLVWI